MTTAIQRLRAQEFEAEADWVVRPDREDEDVLEDEQVARLLQGTPERAQPDRDRGDAVEIEAAVEGDALAAMRGIMIGLGLTSLFWAAIAAIILLT